MCMVMIQFIMLQVSATQTYSRHMDDSRRLDEPLESQQLISPQSYSTYCSLIRKSNKLILKGTKTRQSNSSYKHRLVSLDSAIGQNPSLQTLLYILQQVAT